MIITTSKTYKHNFKSDFVSIHGIFSLEKLPNRLRPSVDLFSPYTNRTDTSNNRYMSAYLSAFFSLPVQRQSGVKLSHEEVVNQLDNETVSYEAGLGISNSFSDTMRVSIKVETAMYEKAVSWLKDLVYGAEFDKDR